MSKGYNFEELKRSAFRKGRRDGHLRTLTASYVRPILREQYKAGYREGAAIREGQELALVKGDTFRIERGATLEEMSKLVSAKVGERYLVGFRGANVKEAVAEFATSGEARAFIRGASTP